MSILQQRLTDAENQIEILMSENERLNASQERKKAGRSDESYIREISDLKNQLETFKSNNFVSYSIVFPCLLVLGHKTTCYKV